MREPASPMKAAVAMAPELHTSFFGPSGLARLAGRLDFVAALSGDAQAIDIATGAPVADETLSEVELLVACWGAPRLDATLLQRMPRLRALVYTAGSVRGVMTEEAYERGIAVSSAAPVNALPVAEYTLGAVLLSGKRVFEIDREYRSTGDYRPAATRMPRWGNNGLRVGIVSASRIGRRVIELLRPFDVELMLWDPVCDEQFDGVRRVELDELLSCSDVVSVHAPELPETRHLIDRAALARMPDGATLINTSRGSLVDQDALLDELRSRRLHAVLDVTEPDVLPAGHPLLSAPNLVLTPHIAGSQGNEFRRLGDAAVEEIDRLRRGEPFRRGVPRHAFAQLA